MTYEAVKNNPAVKTYIEMADKSLAALGYTEHSFAHVGLVAQRAGDILATMGAEPRQVELVKIAAHLHDIGNLVNRSEHSQSGAVMAFRLLENMGFSPLETAEICTAIGNHDEGTGVPVSPLAAALILADKSDVRRSRVRNTDPLTFDIHDRVNWSVTKTDLVISPDKTQIRLHLTIDTALSAIMDYFEIFLGRMKLCRRAAESLGLVFGLTINGQDLL